MIPTPLKDINQSFNLIIDLPAFIFLYKFKMMTLTFQEHFKFTKMGELVIFFFFNNGHIFLYIQQSSYIHHKHRFHSFVVALNKISSSHVESQTKIAELLLFSS